MDLSKIKLILAPMAGYSDQPFRRLCMANGADETVTELLSANALIRLHKKTFRMAELTAEEKPASVQIFGADPEIMAEAARLVEPTGCIYVDINLGCPARKVVKNGSGSALLENPELVGKIVKAVSGAIQVPVSVKIRSGAKSGKSGMEAAISAAENGAKRITVHARTVSALFSGEPDYDFVAELNEKLSIKGIEVVGNGGIETVKDAAKWIKNSGVKLLMVGRGAIGRPSLFKAIHDGTEGLPVEPLETVMLHCDFMAEFYGADRALGPMKGHLAYYTKGFSSARKFRVHANKAKSFNELRGIIKEFYGKEFTNHHSSATQPV